MSIISEALKKAQGASIEINGIRKAEGKPKERKFRFSLLYVGLFGVLALLFSGGVLFFFLHHRSIKEAFPKEYSPTKNSVVPSDKIEPSTYVAAQVVEPVVKKEGKISLEQSLSGGIDEVKKAIELNGIMYTPEKPLAIINGATWAEGDYVGEIKILKIGKDYINVGLGEEEFVLKLKK